MAVTLDLITNSTSNANTSYTSTSANWQAGDLIVLTAQDNVAGTTVAVTKASGTTLTLEDGSSFSGTTSNVDERSDPSYGNPEFTSIWSTRIDVYTGSPTFTAAFTFAGSGPRRYGVWRVRPNSGDSIPARSVRLRYHYSYTGGSGGANAVDTISMSGSGPGSFDCVWVGCVYTANNLAAPVFNLDLDNDTTYEITSLQNNTGVSGVYNSAGCVGYGQVFSTGDSHRPTATEKIKYVPNPSTTGVKAASFVVYLTEAPTVSGDGSLAGIATLQPTGTATHYASGSISGAATLAPSSDKLGSGTLDAAATLSPSGVATHYASGSLAATSQLVPSGHTGRLADIGRHDQEANTGPGDQGPIDVNVFQGDIVALLLSTGQSDSYADLTAVNCTVYGINGYNTLPLTITAATSSFSGNTTVTYTSANHGLVTDQHVTVTGVSVSSGFNPYNVTDAAITVLTSNTFTVTVAGNVVGTYSSGGTIAPKIPLDLTNVMAAADDGTNTLYARIWIAKVTATSGSATVSCKLRKTSLAGNASLVSISPGIGNYFDPLAIEVDECSEAFPGGGANPGMTTPHLLAFDSSFDPWPTNRGLAFLFAARYNGSARGCAVDFDADGTTDVTTSTGIAGGPGGGGDLNGCDGSPSTVWMADAYYVYPGFTRPSAGGIYVNATTGTTGQKTMCALVISAKRIFEPALAIDEAQPIRYVKGWHLGTATEEAHTGPGVRGVFGVANDYPGPPAGAWPGRAVNWTVSKDVALPVLAQKSRHILFGLGNPGPGPFNGYTLTAWAYKLAPAQIGDIRLNLYDGTTLLQQSGWFTLTSDEEAYSLLITTTVAARTTLRAQIDARTFGTLFQPAVTAIRFAASGGLNPAIALDGTDPTGVRVRIRGQDFYINKIQM